MKRLVLPLLCLLISSISVAQNQRVIKGLVQNEEGFGLVGASITSPGETATAVTSQGGAFEIRVSPYAKKIVATHEGYLSGETEIDGSMIILRLRVDKKNAKNKAKDEAERTDNERQKLKPRKVGEVIANNTLVEEKPLKKTVKPLKAFEGRTVDYEQYLDLSVRGGDFYCSGLNYIGGYRFNQHFFLGVGTGLELYYDDGNGYHDRDVIVIFSRPCCVTLQPGHSDFPITFPLYANFRVNFMKTKWSPYVSALAGYRFSPSAEVLYVVWPSKGVLDDKLRCNLLMASVDFGMNLTMNTGSAFYFGIGFSIEEWGRQHYYNYSDFDESKSSGLASAFRFNLGFSF